jgi:AcrR family transcriptional regulator
MRNASARSGTTTRFERRRERTRLELLAAAVRVMSHKGLHDTKIADIATAADVGVGTFYLHFPTKDALFDAVVEDTVARLKVTVDAARVEAFDPIDEMRRANAAFCRFAHENREVFRIVFGHAATYSDVVSRAQALFAADIERAIETGIAQGAFGPVPADVAAQAIVGMATKVLSWWMIHESVSLDTVTDTLTHLALAGLRAGPQTEGV